MRCSKMMPCFSSIDSVAPLPTAGSRYRSSVGSWNRVRYERKSSGNNVGFDSDRSHNKSLDRSGGCAFCIFVGPARLEWSRAARSTQTLCASRISATKLSSAVIMYWYSKFGTPVKEKHDENLALGCPINSGLRGVARIRSGQAV